MLRPTFGVLMALAASACGTTYNDVAADKPAHKAHEAGQVQTWPGSATLGANKRAIAATLKAEGANDDRIALVLACALAETNEISSDQRDVSKDGAGPAKNFSAFNMNAYALSKLGWAEGQSPDINNNSCLSDATRLFNKGLDLLGETQWLCLHRGGEQALRDQVSYGCQDYVAAMRAIQAFLLADLSRVSDNQRYGMPIQHV